MSFGKNFLWGAATAAPQIEGAWKEDGKVPSIWDIASPERILRGETCHNACDHYHRMEQDVTLMKELGLRSYRFSVSWPRIITNAEGTVNEKGLAFYDKLVGLLKNVGIEPVCTLYHWDLPLWMYERGGWLNEEVAAQFEKYVRVVVARLSDRVKYWITVNEPQCFIGVGYQSGTHAPFHREPPVLIHKLTRNVMLAHGRAVRAIRETAKLKPLIGFAPTAGVTIPEGTSVQDIELAREKTFTAVHVGGNGWWSDPIVLGKLPEVLRGAISEEDMRTIVQPLDFYAFNLYTAVNFDGKTTLDYVGMPRTDIGWAIEPVSMYWACKFLWERYRLPIFVTENGMANADFVMSDGKVHDAQRIEYIRMYLRELSRAQEEGIPVLGYQYWSLLDNFEWAEGYGRRFGLIYVDYRTQKRIPKDSAYFYKDVIASGGKNI